ncbi:phosphoribosyltransferase [Sphingomonas sp. 22L2VL55-3]
MQLQTYADLQQDILYNLWKIPDGVDLIVGIPRSGMLAATLIALARNLPLTDLDGFCHGRVFQSGSTRRRAGRESEYRHALIVDDSSRTGTAMIQARTQISASPVNIPATTTCVVYGGSTLGSQIDIIMKDIDGPRIFEWNVLQHPGILKDACLDIDGVICHDPSHVENDDGDAYSNFLANARPLHIPSHPIRALVTSRLERYRPETEDWLRRHNVKYGELIMLDLPDGLSRRRLGVHGSHKAAYYSNSPATLFIESEMAQAFEIARLSGKPVLSLEGPIMCMPGAMSPRALRQRFTNTRLFARWLRGKIGDQRVDRLRDLYLRVAGNQNAERSR